MPSKYVVRNFSENKIYHVFNRGVEKRKIFMDEQDYNMFLYYLFIYTASLEKILKKYPQLPFRLQGKNLYGEIEIISYCLMPNHIHLLLKQNNKDSISRLIKQLTNAYTLYFNQKYKRVGGLMQGRFKAVDVNRDDLLIHISRYIHLNPVVANLTKDAINYQWSSLQDYFDKLDGIILNKNTILSYFSSLKDYKNFILDQVDYARNLEMIKHLVIED